MSKSQQLQDVLNQAEAKTREYNWLKAAELYEQTLRLVEKCKEGELQEKIGFCFHRAAMQAESQEEFKERMQRAIETYEKAYGLYEKQTDEMNSVKMLRSKAITKYLSYWLISNPSEKRKLLDECLKLEDKALAFFSESGDMLEYGRTYNELSQVFSFRGFLEWSREKFEDVLKKGRIWGEKAVAALNKLDDRYEIVRTYLTLTSCMIPLWWFFIAAPEEQEQNRFTIEKYLNKTIELSERVDDIYLCGQAHLSWGLNNLEGEETVKHLEKALQCGENCGDNYLIAWSCDLLAYMAYWKSLAVEVFEQKKNLAEEAMQYYDKAQHHYSIISFKTPRYGSIGPPAGYAEYYLDLATWETDPDKRLELLERSEREGVKALRLAEDSDIPIVIGTVLHVYSKTLGFRAQIEPDPLKRKSFLEKALEYRAKTIEIEEQLFTFDHWSLGVMQNYLAEIEAELANVESNYNNKKRLLEDAVSNGGKALKLCNKAMEYYERGARERVSALQGYHDSYASILIRLHDLTDNREHLRSAIEVCLKAIELARKENLVSRMAESYWKIAKAQDVLSEYSKAVENFNSASKYYNDAAEKIPQLTDFYKDHTLYMQAWSEIEKAKQYHTEKRYGLAKRHYKKSANLHKSTQRWSYLSANYLAWSILEEAEDLSRREQPEKARNLFQQASKLFEEAKKSIQARMETIDVRGEKEMSVELIEASDLRNEYCIGRIALEEAIILDQNGDHAGSSQKYGLAAETFQKAIEATACETDRQELTPIVCLCHAWQMMTRAEAEVSPNLYLEASKLFEEAKEKSVDEKNRLLAFGHSWFCKALESGTRFEKTGNTTFHLEATHQLGVAANYYVRAGFETTSEYAIGTERLFDAYVYMNNAKKEVDPEKKARYYLMAEKVLAASVESYSKAKHPTKSHQVQQLLKKVRSERELAMSMSEILHAPTITSSTISFTTPTPTHEEAVGLERFEHADVQASLFVKVKLVMVGEKLKFRMELVNSGKAPALFVKVENIAPKSFEVKEVPRTYIVEDNSINMKGKILNPLKIEDLRVTVKPESKGTFALKPRIYYLDETGKSKSHEPQPITLTVKELGITGWIRGRT